MYIIWIIRNIIYLAYTYIFVGCADPRRENAARAAYEALETQSDGVCRCKDGRGRRWRKNVEAEERAEEMRCGLDGPGCLGGIWGLWGLF